MAKQLQTTPTKKVDTNKPYPVRMGEFKPLYQSEAVKRDRSMHWLILQAIKEYEKTFSRK